MQLIYVSSLFLEAVHLPQYKLFSRSKDEATRVATIIFSLSSVSVTVVGIAAKYLTYTMFKFMNEYWERGIWTHGANVAYFVVGSICLVSALLSHPQQGIQKKK